MPFTLRPITEGDFFAWLALFEGYNEFYQTPAHDTKAVLVWTWLTETTQDISALVAEDAKGKLIGFAHYSGFVRTMVGETGIQIDDLFVLPDARQAGVGTALIEAVHEIASSRNAGLVRWQTAKENHAGRKLSASMTSKTAWVTYDLPVKTKEKSA
jgi:GNAT superfamily N-acetyltransferase